MTAVSIHNFQIALFACVLGQIPSDRLRDVIARWGSVSDYFLVGSAAEADETLLPRRFVGRAVVAGQEEAQFGRDGEWFGAQDAGELLAAGRKAGDELRGFI